MTHGRMEIISWNIQSYSNSKDSVTKLLGKDPDVLILQETCLDPLISLQQGRRVIAASRRRAGGVAMFFADRVKFTPGPIYKSEKFIQIVSAVIGDLTIFGTYISPQLPAAQLRNELKTIHESCTGRKIIIGDLNSRHTAWDTNGNTNGAALRRWTEANAWRVTAPPAYTFHGARGSSTVDLAVSKRCDNLQVRNIYGEWDGASDHTAISAKLPYIAPRRSRQNRISKSRRKRGDLHEKAEQIYSERMPECIHRFRRVEDAASLNRAYIFFCTIILSAFLPKGKPRPTDSSPGWTQELDAMAKIRSRLYHRMIRTKHPADKRRYKSMNKRIKRLYKKEKRKCFKEFAQELNFDESTNVSRRISGVMRAKRRNRTNFAPRQDPDLRLEKFTNYVANKFRPTTAPVQPRYFFVTDKMEQLIARAAQVAPAGKAEGEDQTFGELFRICPQHTTPALCELWKACGRVADIPQQWKNFKLVALHKKKSKSDPKNYRPIALISHTRKIIEKALDWKVKEATSFHRFQCGFRANRCIEQAILRYRAAKRMGHMYTAVLDLRGAYPSVPREKLFRVVCQRLRPNLASEISMFLGTDTVSTCGDETNAKANVRVGVPEGSPLSPTIFNLYIDELASELEKVKQKHANLPATIYADDVVIFAKSHQGLKKSLRICTDWAKAAGMEWATETGKSCVLAPPHCTKDFHLAGRIIEKVASTKYLGVVVNFEGVLHADTETRIDNASDTISLMGSAGLLRGSFMARRIHIYKTFIRPKYEFGIHLTEWQDKYRKALVELDMKILYHPVYTTAERTWNRYYNILGIDDLRTRRNKLGKALIDRLRGHIANGVYSTPEERWIADLELDAAESLYTDEELAQPDKKQKELTTKIEKKIPDRRCCYEGNEFPVTSLPGPFVRMAVLWYFGRFPYHQKKGNIPRYEERKGAVKGIMRQPKWTSAQRQLVIDEFKVYAQHTGYVYDYNIE